MHGSAAAGKEAVEELWVSLFDACADYEGRGDQKEAYNDSLGHE